MQTWDWNQAFDPKNPNRKPHLGSGGLFNNTSGTAGRDPLVLADKLFGQWNQFRIRQIGDRTWVWLNGKLVVDGAVMENYWDRSKPLPTKGPIMLHPGGRADVPTLRQFVGGAGPAQTVSESADVRQATGRGSRAVGFRLAYQAAFKG